MSKFDTGEGVGGVPSAEAVERPEQKRVSPPLLIPFTSTEEEKMGLYEELLKIDVIGPIAGALKERSPWIDPHGKIHLYQQIIPGHPWLYVLMPEVSERLCGVWHQVYFDLYKIVPKGCRFCWKVVWTGTTLDQLFRMVKLQEEMGLEAKCGTETRPWSGKLGTYRGFWYSPLSGGLDGGRELYKKIVDKFAKDKVVGGTELILKRGCTEMEQFFSPSDSWDVLVGKGNWDGIEDMLNGVWIPPFAIPQRGPLNICTQIGWIQYGWEHRDPTVVRKYPNKYLDNPLKPKALQYQRSVHSGKDYIGWEGSGEPISLEPPGDKSKIITEF